MDTLLNMLLLAFAIVVALGVLGFGLSLVLLPFTYSAYTNAADEDRTLKSNAKLLAETERDLRDTERWLKHYQAKNPGH